MSVTNAPQNAPDMGVAATLPSVVRNRDPANALRPLVMTLMPSRNRPTPPRTETVVDTRSPSGAFDRPRFRSRRTLRCTMPRLRAGIAVVLALVVISGAVSLAQRFGVFEGAGAGIRVPPKDFNDGGFTICKWMFRSDRSEAGGIGWSTDYPFGEINLLTRLSEMTKVHVSRDGRGDVNYWVVQLTDDQLFECPMLIGTDVGTAALSNKEVERLRQYLLKGGFLW